MTQERHARIKAVFLEALACSIEQREALLLRRCEDDPSLRLEIEELLAHHDERTITPDTQAPTAATNDWRQAVKELSIRSRDRPNGRHVVAKKHGDRIGKVRDLAKQLFAIDR